MAIRSMSSSVSNGVDASRLARHACLDSAWVEAFQQVQKHFEGVWGELLTFAVLSDEQIDGERAEDVVSGPTEAPCWLWSYAGIGMGQPPSLGGDLTSSVNRLAECLLPP
jgi:hypothetical protein